MFDMEVELMAPHSFPKRFAYPLETKYFQRLRPNPLFIMKQDHAQKSEHEQNDLTCGAEKVKYNKVLELNAQGPVIISKLLCPISIISIWGSADMSSV